MEHVFQHANNFPLYIVHDTQQVRYHQKPTDPRNTREVMYVLSAEGKLLMIMSLNVYGARDFNTGAVQR